MTRRGPRKRSGRRSTRAPKGAALVRRLVRLAKTDPPSFCALLGRVLKEA
jgi:hypothetical protein